MRHSCGNFSWPFALAVALLGWAYTAQADDAGPIGFGSKASAQCAVRDPGCICVVSSLDDKSGGPSSGTLRGCLQDRTAHWVKFQARGIIQLVRPIVVAGPKVIDGRPMMEGDGAVTISGAGRLLILKDTQNVIISDLNFQANLDRSPARCKHPTRPAEVSGCGAAIVAEGAQDLWIHHNDFANCGNACIALWTLAMKGGEQPFIGSDRVSISNNVFHDSYYGVFAGAGNDVAPEDIPAHMRVSVYENVFYNIFRRSPKASSGVQLHLFNNVIADWGPPDEACKGANSGFAASSTGEAQMLIERNVFAAFPKSTACKNAAEFGKKIPLEGFERADGRLRAIDNLLLNGAFVQENHPEQVFNPAEQGSAFFYAYKALPVEDVSRYLKAAVGPRLGSGSRNSPELDQVLSVR